MWPPVWDIGVKGIRNALVLVRGLGEVSSLNFWGLQKVTKTKKILKQQMPAACASGDFEQAFCQAWGQVEYGGSAQGILREVRQCPNPAPVPEPPCSPFLPAWRDSERQEEMLSAGHFGSYVGLCQRTDWERPREDWYEGNGDFVFVFCPNIVQFGLGTVPDTRQAGCRLCWFGFGFF